MVLLASGPHPQRGFLDFPLCFARKGCGRHCAVLFTSVPPASLPPARMTQRERATLQFLLFTEASGLPPHKGD